MMTMSENSRPILAIAKAIGRRGQTIHGRETIVDLCSKAGVSLMDRFDDEISDPDSDEDLENFVAAYAKLCPASRLTVMVLAKQYGAKLPEEITKRRRTLRALLEQLSEYFPKVGIS